VLTPAAEGLEDEHLERAAKQVGIPLSARHHLI
jgi:hypothetical protein